MKDFSKYLNEQLEDDRFKEEFDLQSLKLSLLVELNNEMVLNKLTKTELAKRLGLKRANLSRIMNQKTEPTLDMIYKIGRGLGMTLETRFVKKDYTSN